VEDAVSGVQAGASGNFGLVLGVAREHNELELKRNGADIVVKDIGEIRVEDVDAWFEQGLEEDSWTLSYFDYDPYQEGTREALCTVGNGYFGTRGALEECEANSTNYPGTYIAGIYNRLESEIAGRTIVNEDFVNCPNWIPITFRINNGDWVNPNEMGVESFIRRMDFRDGVLHREILVRDAQGRQTRIQSSRFASMAHPHLAAQRYRITPINYSGEIAIQSGLDGSVVNAGVERYRQLNSKHLQPLVEGGEGNVSHLLVTTNQSEIQIAEAAKLRVVVDDAHIDPAISIETMPGAVFSRFDVAAEEGSSIVFEKIVAIYTSRDEGVETPLLEAQNAVEGVESFDKVYEESAAAWADIWEEIDIQVEGDRLAQKLLRLNLYHTLVTTSPHNAYIDAGIPARGLHGEAYRGHIFWDEMYILPLYNLHFPEVVRSVLLYRYRRLDRAREYAIEHGHEGAMFPWQSGSDGREETQVIHLNPISGEWGPDYSSLQRHVSLAIAYNIWNYFWATEDYQFLEHYGAEMFLEICRFWASMTSFDEGTQRFSIDGVMGPDEYHEKIPGAQEGGLKDNSYTNIMVVWIFERAFEMLDLLGKEVGKAVLEEVGLTEEALSHWEDICKRIRIPISDEGILEQFEGYFELEELDWRGYREKYKDIHRMDRILKAEGKSPDDYKVSKQADALMAFYLLDPDGVAGVLQQAGYPTAESLLVDNFNYYFPRTSHGSTLSSLVHSYLAHLLGDRALRRQLYLEALKSDYVDIQGGTTKEGIHAGVMAGVAVLTLKSFAGLTLDGDVVCLKPSLPEIWRKMQFTFRFKGERYDFVLTPEKVDVKVDSSSKRQTEICVGDQIKRVDHRSWTTIS
ncbi:MAG: beta-phosphoglucomutase, partial [Anaerolineales bacterium]|nr:beta-phosphoglucomutase [Anaerolineales bacterium]